MRVSHVHGQQLKVLRGLVCVLAALVAALQIAFGASPTAEVKTSRYFESIRNSPNRLRVFLQQMPKGGDLHNHLVGAIYAETYITLAAKDGLCVDRATSSFVPPPCGGNAKTVPAVTASSDSDLYAQLIDAFSMRHFDRGRESGHDHFFATFPKFYSAARGNTGELLAEARTHAARDHVQYLELMVTPEDGAPALGGKTGWNGDAQQTREKMLAGGLAEVVAAARKELDDAETKSDAILHCHSAQAAPACDVTVRFLYQVLRGLPPEQVFAQILTGFELAKANPRVVGLNLVMPEDAYVPMHNFDLHMEMLSQLAVIYPEVPITLHAGELTPQLVPPDGLFHIRASIERAHARRIGHGVDVLHEADPNALLNEMANKKILVEICLTSNDEILGVRGNQHPFTEYQRAGVPLALATDDEGVSRSDMTQEFVRAVEAYHLTYSQLRTLARNSLQFSFLPGASLWQDSSYTRRATACAAPNKDGSATSACRDYLQANLRALEQWKLEQSLSAFEKELSRP
jgi:adenosine deaminase